jgi:O-antigen ligase
MSERARPFAVPAYVLLCLLLGGNSQGILGNLLLQLGGVALLAWAALTRTPSVLTDDARTLGWLSAAALCLVAVQFLPLPPAVWTILPGREPIAQGYALLGQQLPWLPWSLAPYDTLASGLSLLPPLAIVAGIVRLGAHRGRYLATAIVVGTVAGILLGAVQVSSRWGYLYSVTSRGQAAGFFANANYMGTLLLSAIPFTLALLARHRAGRGQAWRKRLGVHGVIAGALALLLLGLLLNQSMAAMLLTLPTLLASAALLVAPGSRGRFALTGVALVAGAVGCVAIASMTTLVRGDAAVSVSTRQDIYARSAQIAGDMFPAGAGLGAFPRVYPWYENPDTVDFVYVNHVHNDYLELVLEAGLPGALLLLAALFWWALRSVQVWRSPVSGRFAKAATVASAAILAHSAVDFPIRTAAIAAVFATCIALMAEPRVRRTPEPEGVRTRPARHLSLE